MTLIDSLESSRGSDLTSTSAVNSIYVSGRESFSPTFKWPTRKTCSSVRTGSVKEDTLCQITLMVLVGLLTNANNWCNKPNKPNREALGQSARTFSPGVPSLCSSLHSCCRTWWSLSTPVSSFNGRVKTTKNEGRVR